ncbi:MULTISPECIES: colicin immunity domain-containing protein [Xanthomonas]|uniref:colicin immunity domain-containing protein n=2 Tax=Xanthomonas TaxID=338 RepID=UPI00126453C3|nr:MULTISPECIES: colicin immunity domain-containing protein [Xanthomonas]KAB7780764.1 colicin immunity protein [Xanthomonas sp. LMG 12460]MDY4282988.1 colicin immunity domain-containing protein [Xanthomonas sp. LF06-19]
MSIVLFDFAKSFALGRLDAHVFSEAYIELWRIERDRGIMIKDVALLSECLSSIFCSADMYNEDANTRRSFELDEAGLLSKVCDEINRFEKANV